MSFPFYLAMTCREYHAAPEKPAFIAWMACHFSPYGTGITNLPQELPPGSMIILNDRTPIFGHDPQRILFQLEACIKKQNAACVLLDLQRPGSEEIPALVEVLLDGLPCPVGVSDLYAKGLNCPVFLPPVPLDMPPETFLSPWQGREIWLEAEMDAQTVLVDCDGARILPGEPKSTGNRCDTLHCSYHISPREDSAHFTLWRTQEDVDGLLESASSLGVTTAVGLYQQWK